MNANSGTMTFAMSRRNIERALKEEYILRPLLLKAGTVVTKEDMNLPTKPVGNRMKIWRRKKAGAIQLKGAVYPTGGRIPLRTMSMAHHI